MRFNDVRDSYLYVMQQKTSKASDAAWFRFVLTTQLQAVISRCRDNVPSPFLVHRRPERKKQKQAEQKAHWTKIEERYLTGSTGGSRLLRELEGGGTTRVPRDTRPVPAPLQKSWERRSENRRACQRG